MEETALKTLIEAIRKTSPIFYKYDSTIIYERLFCYELYHQFRLLQDNHGCEKFRELLFSGEPPKNIEIKIAKICKNNSSGIHKYPDFVLHNRLGDGLQQIMAIEVKRTVEIAKLKDDIVKLQQLVNTDKLQFKIGVFIAIGMTNEELKQALETLEKNEPNIFKKPMIQRVYFIGVESVKRAENISNPYFIYSPKD